MWIRTADSLCCTVQTNTIVESNYIPIQIVYKKNPGQVSSSPGWGWRVFGKAPGEPNDRLTEDHRALPAALQLQPACCSEGGSRWWTNTWLTRCSLPSSLRRGCPSSPEQALLQVPHPPTKLTGFRAVHLKPPDKSLLCQAPRWHSERQDSLLSIRPNVSNSSKGEFRLTQAEKQKPLIWNCNYDFRFVGCTACNTQELNGEWLSAPNCLS